MRQFVAPAALALVLISLPSLNAQTTSKSAPPITADVSGKWEQVPMPPKTQPDPARVIYFGPSGEMYVSFEKEGMWRTDDFGKTWQNMQYDLPAPVGGGQYCLNKQGELLYSTPTSANRGIYRLTAANKWEPAKMDWKGLSGADAIARITLNKAGDVIAISAGCQVLRSTDGGKSFTHTGNALKGAALFDLRVSPLDPNEFALGNEIGPTWRSTDGGLTWTDIGKAGGNARLAYNRLGQLFSSSTHDAAAKGWLLARWTGEQNWVSSGKGLPAYEDTRCSVLASSGVMFVGNTGVSYSKDDGATWASVGTGFPAGGGRRVHVRYLAIGPDGYLYAAISSTDKTEPGIWRLQIGPATSRPTSATSKP